MLDQNTDRMWYVIGAVIVGAAIILILNGTMPQIFASVAETFEEKTDEVTTVTDSIRPNTRENILEQSQWENGILYGMFDSHQNIVPSTDGKHWYTRELIPTHGAKSITIELFDELPDFGGSYGRVNAYDSNKQLIASPVDNLNRNTPYKVIQDLPAGTAYIRVMLLHYDKGEYSFVLNP